MKTAIIYTRVSTAEQVQGASLTNQETACRAYCRREKLKVIGIFRDAGESARTANRPGLQAAIKTALAKKAAAFVVWKVDRLARRQVDFHTIRAVLRGKGVCLLSSSETFGDEPAGRFLQGILAAAAQFDNDTRIERTRAGMHSRMRQGGYTSRAPIGYLNRRTEAGVPSLTPDPITADGIKRAFGLAADGARVPEILAMLKKRGIKTRRGRDISPQSLHRVFRNPVYAGMRRLDGALVEGAWPPLITRRLWSFVQEQRDRNAKVGYVKRRADFQLRGIIYCVCGKPLTGGWATGAGGAKYRYYWCRGHHARTTRAETLHEAFRGVLRLVKVDRLFLSMVQVRIQAEWEDYQARERARREARDKRRGRLLEKKSRLLDLYLDGRVSRGEYERRAGDIQLEIDAAQEEENSTGLTAERIAEAISLAGKVLRNPEKAWSEIPWDRRQAFFKLIFRTPPVWDAEKQKFLNIGKPLILSALGDIEGDKSQMGSLKGAGLNAILRFSEAIRLLLKVG